MAGRQEDRQAVARVASRARSARQPRRQSSPRPHAEAARRRVRGRPATPRPGTGGRCGGTRSAHPRGNRGGPATGGRHRDLLSPVIGRRRHARRQRPPLPGELTDDTIHELLALLGPDLGEVGEEVLRRVARDEPWQLAPAVEQPLTGRALAGYRPGLLADLTEAYYVDEEEDGSGSTRTASAIITGAARLPRWLPGTGVRSCRCSRATCAAGWRY